MSDRKILLVEDSDFFRSFSESILNAMGGFTVCGTASTPAQAKEKIQKLRPEMIVMDSELFKGSAITFLRQLIPQYTVPIIICSAKNNLLTELFDVGAAAFVEKPEAKGYDLFKDNLIRSVRTAATLKKIKCDDKYYSVICQRVDDPNNKNRIIAIGGSTGSTDALPVILKGLNCNCPPTVVTLHLPAGYTTLLVKRLCEETRLVVKEAVNGLYLENGMVVIAQGDYHMRVLKDSKGYFISSKRGQKISGHCPSVDVLFDSVAACAGANATGVLLTGMGSDGARGMRLIKSQGGYTIGQSEKTCLVYGMPKVAFELGAVDKQVDLENISSHILNRTKPVKV